MLDSRLKNKLYHIIHFISGQSKVKLSDTYIGILDINKVQLDIERADVVRTLEVHLPSNRTYERKIIKQYWMAPNKRKDKIFDKLVSAVDRIAPEGCYFGEKRALWGFWKIKKKI